MNFIRGNGYESVSTRVLGMWKRKERAVTEGVSKYITCLWNMEVSGEVEMAELVVLARQNEGLHWDS